MKSIKVSNFMKSVIAISIVILLIFVSNTTKAESDTYVKIGVGYILNQPDNIKYNWTQQLQYSPFSAHIESGLQIGQWSTGIHYAKGKGDRHDPSKLEYFVDYDWMDSSKWQLITGIGYKLMYQDYVHLRTGVKDTYNKGDSDDFSARIGLSRSYGMYEIGLWHHSQWFTGVPINDTWEYHKTEITFGVRF